MMLRYIDNLNTFFQILQRHNSNTLNSKSKRGFPQVVNYLRRAQFYWMHCGRIEVAIFNAPFTGSKTLLVLKETLEVAHRAVG